MYIFRISNTKGVAPYDLAGNVLVDEGMREDEGKEVVKVLEDGEGRGYDF